jgi:hypothetical protein
MLFGSRDSFAIESMTEPHLRAPSQVWGRMRIWCRGTEIGDYSDEHCGLFDAYVGFKELRERLAWNWMPEFSGLSDTDLWDFLDGTLFGYHGDVELLDSRTVDECKTDWARYGKFSFLTNWGEQFEKNGKSFIVCRPDGDVRILNRSFGNSSDFSLEVPLAEAIEVIQKFIDWFQGESIRLAGRPPS